MSENLYTATQTRKLDQISIEEYGIPGSTLMARAADAVFKTLTDQYPDQKNIAIFCGTGNNGGDGFVLARICQPLGYKVKVFFIGQLDDLKDDALTAYQNLQGTKAQIEEFTNQDLSECSLIVDALFGSGLCRNIEGEYAKAIEAINKTLCPVVAIDLPSGIHADTGQVMGIAVLADDTVSFIARKQGLYTNDGPEHSGNVIFSDLDVPNDVYKQLTPSSFLLSHSELSDQWPKRSLNAHKGDYGHVLVAGGNTGYSGAAQLAAQGALRVGAGLVSVATREQHASTLDIACPELMVHACENSKDFQTLLSKVSVLAVGPGLGQDQWADMIFENAINTDLPLILDADALNLLAKNPTTRKNWILTPHPGEAARLLECKTADIQNDRFHAANELSKKYAAIVVLKGCGTLIASDKGIRICPYGNPGMSAGGMGDILTGMLAGILGQHKDKDYSTEFAVSLHSFAADLMYEEYGAGYGPQKVLNNPLPKPF